MVLEDREEAQVEIMHVGEGLRSLPPTPSMDEHIKLVEKVGKQISHRNLDHLLEMDMKKFKYYANQPYNKRKS